MNPDPHASVIAHLDRMVGAYLFDAPAADLTPELIRQTISQVRLLPAFSTVDDSDAESLAKDFERRHAIRIDVGAVLQEKHDPWLDGRKESIDPYYWNRYRRLLSEKGLGIQVLGRLNDVSDRILGLLEDPQRQGNWSRRGLVLGSVQSGKTANYLGLICKAADAGYQVVIVIAGIHNKLRNQTQSRIDEGFVGREKGATSTKLERVVGVGKYDATRQPAHFTSAQRDFTKSAASQVGVPLQNLVEPAVFVIKKNSTTLKNLIDWLKASIQVGGRIGSPLLLIDDEADNASINVASGPNEVSRINGLIRQLLDMFDRSCYVGYTATPFANIFIDPSSRDEMLGQDLFPRHFIVSLDPPSNYFGPQRVFIEDPEQYLREVADNEDLLPIRHKKELVVEGLPDSLQDAVRAFVLARAIRLERGQQGEHNSMLVNCSRFTNVQSQLRDVLHHFLEGIQDEIRVNGALDAPLGHSSPELMELKRVFDTEYPNAGVTWPQVRRRLHSSAAPIKVIEINSKSTGSLDYSDSSAVGLNAIAVGGFSLSRGLTLEGLVTTYFLRNSVMYDTLMQMGRWFGYRQGYEDLCRIWMPPEAVGWYAHVAESLDILRADLRRMEAINATPEDFGLRVRAHPDALMITARNKLGAGQNVVVRLGLAESFVETAALDVQAIPANARAAAGFIAHSLLDINRRFKEEAKATSNGWLLQGVGVELVLDFIQAFRNDEASMLTATGPIASYIQARHDDELAIWDLLVVSRNGEQATRTSRGQGWVDVGGLPVQPPRRTAGAKSNVKTLRIGDKQRVASRGIEKAGLSPETVRMAESEYKARLDVDSDKVVNYPDHIYRAVRTRPLFMIHPLQIGMPKRASDRAHQDGGRMPDDDPFRQVEFQVPVIAWGISMPRTELEEQTVEYRVNAVWIQENLQPYPEIDEEEQDDDEG